MPRFSSRVAFAAMALATVALGLWVHLHAPLGAAVRDVLGDALWAAMIVWLVAALVPGAPAVTRLVVSLGICAAVEFSQLIHGAGLDAIRRTTLGHLVLGSGFDPRDLLAYACGAVTAAALEYLARGRRVRAALTVLALTVVAGRAAAGQERAWAEREYGIGVVRYSAMESYAARDVIFAAPNASADTVAVLARDSLCFKRPRSCVRSYDRMIEFDYEIPGWAIRRFSRDSAWAEVALAPAQASGPVGWVRLRRDTVTALLWSEELPRHSLFFLRPQDIAFYRAPDARTTVSVPLAHQPGSGRLNYSMQPLVARGPWLRVQVVTPSNNCDPPAIVRTDTLWIQYLGPTGRPRVFYYTRGC